jgi:hypothetical protein
MVMFVNGSGRNEHSLKEHSIDVSYKVSFHLANRFQMKIILKISQSVARTVWRQCLLADQNEMSNLYRGSSTAAS